MTTKVVAFTYSLECGPGKLSLTVLEVAAVHVLPELLTKMLISPVLNLIQEF